MKYDTLSRLGILLLSFVIAIWGIYHFIFADDLIVNVPDFLPGDKIWVYTIGFCLVIVSVAFATRHFIRLAGYLLAFILVIIILFVNVPNCFNVSGTPALHASITILLKNLAILGFALFLATSAENR